MQFPQHANQAPLIHRLETADVDELAAAQQGKNRRYTQLQAGSFQGLFSSVQLGSAQLIRERLTTGLRLEAAPNENFLPFAAVLSRGDEFRFCGRKLEEDRLLQATGGGWDIQFKQSLDYVGCIFDRDSFSRGMTLLLGRPPPAQWFASKSRRADPRALRQFKQWMHNTLQQLEARPQLLAGAHSRRLMDACALQLANRVLLSTRDAKSAISAPSRRMQGVRRVIDYLHVHAAELPTIPELCAIAEISERSLEYGFREQLGMTPVRYLRLLRLNGCRRKLKQCAANSKVSDIALRWGFLELGRFSGDYKRLFGELPSATLRHR